MSDPLGLLGLGMRAGRLVVGTGGVRAGLQRDEFVAVVVAEDASSRTKDKVVRLALARSVPTLRGPDAIRIGLRLGRGPIQAVGIRDKGLAFGLMNQLPTVK